MAKINFILFVKYLYDHIKKAYAKLRPNGNLCLDDNCQLS